MIWLLASLALASPLDTERALAQLELGRPEAALEHAETALREDPRDWRAARAWVAAMDAGGLGAMVMPHLSDLASESTELTVVRSWEQARRLGDVAPVLVEGTKAGAEVPTIALASLALEAGGAELALDILEGRHSVDLDALRLDALVVAERHKEATAVAKALAEAAPERPDLLLPLFASTSPALGGAKKRALKGLSTQAATSTDPAWLFRAHRLLLAAADPATEQTADRLVRLGEARPATRATLDEASIAATARSLAQQRQPALPPGRPAEVQAIGLALAAALRDMGRIDDALQVYRAARASHDTVTLAVAEGLQLLRSGRLEPALKAAQDALRLASAPASDDLGRLDEDRWRLELAAAYLLRAQVFAALERMDEAVSDALAAAFIAPSAEAWAGASQLEAAIGYSVVAFTAAARARQEGGDVDRSLQGLWGSEGWLAAAEAATAAQGPPSTEGVADPQRLERIRSLLEP